ncbi:MAG: pilin [bacterium]|nr:pilin [bacterium]
MKKYFYIFFIIIIGVIGFLNLSFSSNVKAAETLRPIQKTGDVVPIIEITIDQLNAPENNCKDNKLRATDDVAARKQCPAQEPFYRNIGKMGDKYYCCQPPALLVVQTPLGPVAPGDQAARNELIANSACGEGYDYPIGPQPIFPYEKIDKGLNIAWPASPMGTPFTGANGIPGLIKYIYDWLIGLGGLMVFITLIWAGVQYLTSAGNPTQMSEARKRIKTSSIGLALLFGSWLILNTINPILINLGVTGNVLSGGTASDFGTKGTKGSAGSPCGTPCEEVRFYSEINYGGVEKIFPLAGKKTIAENWSVPGGVKSIKFWPYKLDKDPPEVGDCLVVLYQLPKGGRLLTDEKPPSPPIYAPVKDIGSDGFPMQSFQASDVSGSGGSYFNFQPKK